MARRLLTCAVAAIAATTGHSFLPLASPASPASVRHAPPSSANVAAVRRSSGGPAWATPTLRPGKHEHGRTLAVRLAKPTSPLEEKEEDEFDEMERKEAEQAMKMAQFRRSVYEALLPLDRGDFRWELLVPWTDKVLTRADKIIVCSTFIGIAIVMQELFDPLASVGVHLSYIAQFFSYAIGNPIGFRVIAIVSSLLEVAGDLLETDTSLSDDAIPVIYNVLFIPINGYYVMRYLLNREAIPFTEEEEALYTRCFAPLGFARGQFSRLVSAGSFEKVEEPTTLCTQGEPLKELFVAINGTVDVVVGGVVAARIPPYQVIGEASLLENLQSEGGNFHQPSRATIVAEPGAAFVRWSQRSFFELQASDPEIAYTIQLMIARTLSNKLRSARIAQQTTVETTGAQPQLVGQLRTEEEQDLYQKSFEALGVSQDQYTRILSLATFETATSFKCCGGGFKLVEAGEPWSRVIIPIRGAIEADAPTSAGSRRTRPVEFPSFSAIETATTLRAIQAYLPVDGAEPQVERGGGGGGGGGGGLADDSDALVAGLGRAAAAPAKVVEAVAMDASADGEVCTSAPRAPAKRVRGTREEALLPKLLGNGGRGEEGEGGEERPVWVFPQADFDIVAVEGTRWVSWPVADMANLMMTDPELDRLIPLLLTSTFDERFVESSVMATEGVAAGSGSQRSRVDRRDSDYDDYYGWWRQASG